jgi:RNA polymerase sigma-70 factor, ECF subfamily
VARTRLVEGRASVRSWLYKIATNACLNVRRARTRRVMPESLGPSGMPSPLGEPETDIPWLEPYPDTLFDRLADQQPGPEARYELREAVRLSFIAALQDLPAKQRAVLILRDVLGWSASETAELLETSTAATNSALQRARATLEARPRDLGDVGELVGTRERALLDRYVRTWEDADIDGFVALLKEDAVWTMPPWREWFVGRAPIRGFLEWAFRPGKGRRRRLLPTRANGAPAFAYYRSGRDSGPEWRAFAIQVLDLRDGKIAGIHNFVDPELFAGFSLPEAMPVDR